MPIAALAVAVLLALGLIACGGGDDSGSTPSEVATPGQEEPGGGAGEANGSGERDGSRSDGSEGSDERGSGSASPRQHDDSGGGSAQFRVKGGDNSIQDFGAEAGGSEFEQAAAALHGFLDARVDGDWARACSFLATDVADSLKQFTGKSEQLKGKGCAGILEALSGGVPRAGLVEAAQADVGSLRTEDDRAFVIYRGAEDTVYAMPMARQDGEWKVAALAGTPIS